MPLALYALLALTFAPVVDLTGSPDFRTRERGSAILLAWWPLSAPAIDAGQSSPDPEVRARCHRAEREGPEYQFFGGRNEARLLAEMLVYHEYEIDGIPWARHSWAVRWGRRSDVRASLSAIASELKLRGPDGDDIFGFEHPATYRDPYPYGLDDLRFRARGIPSAMRPFPTDTRYFKRLRAEWAAIKSR